MNAVLSILAMVLILIIVANRTIYHYAVATVLGIPLLAYASKTVALSIDSNIIIPQWMIIAYAAASVLLVGGCCVWLAANRTTASLTHTRTRLRYGAHARRRVAARVQFVTQEKPAQ